MKPDWLVTFNTVLSIMSMIGVFGCVASVMRIKHVLFLVQQRYEKERFTRQMYEDALTSIRACDPIIGEFVTQVFLESERL